MNHYWDRGSPLKYVLITAARNEERTVGWTIESVIAQTRRPLEWLIVSDGSTDGTDAIVRRYAADEPWIRLVRTPQDGPRNFGAKARCFEAGRASLRCDTYEVIGCLDADLSFEKDYFEYLLAKLDEDPFLGVVGTPFVEGDGRTYDYRYTSIEHVSGACQLFRRRCFEEVGGYVPIPEGGIDWVAVTTARMMGWRTCTFNGRSLTHHRAMGAGGGRQAPSGFRQGVKDYNLGNGPTWESFRCLYQMRRRPYVLGGLSLMAGYLWALVRNAPRPIHPDLVQFVRREHAERLRARLSVAALLRGATGREGADFAGGGTDGK